jgi:hypothetical protein
LVGSSLAYLGARAARSWLGAQPEYRLPFQAIKLDPPPPSWYRGGAAAFLDDVRQRSRMSDTIPLLNLTEKELDRAFQQSPWVEAVERVSYAPLGLTVRLAYCRPVALIETVSDRDYLVDARAVILPHDDLNTDVKRFVQEQGLIEINGRGLAGPRNPKPGIPWQPRPGAIDAASGNSQIGAAARLAGFLLNQMDSVNRAREPALSIRFINPMDAIGRGLFLLNDESTYILWGEAPGNEGPGSPTASEKWEKLREWSRRGNTRLETRKDYWEITSAGVLRMTFGKQSAPESARAAPPRRDGETIPARTSGQ